MFKSCPQCGGEFQAWVSECPDCRVALELGPSAPAPAASRELPPASELVCVERGDPWHLREIAEQLQQRGVSSRIDAYPPDARIRPGARGAGAPKFGLYVLGEDVDLAREVRREQLGRMLPEASPPAAESGAALEACPACGTALREGDVACSECGLEFPELESEG